MATTKVTYNYIDHSAETTRTQLHFVPVAADGANYDTLFTPTTGQIDLVRLALAAATKLNETNVTASILAHSAAGIPPADATAQREAAIRFVYVDDVTNERGRFDLPSPADALVPTGTDDVNMASAAVIALVAVLEANLVSRDNNAITFVSGRYVGRRN